MQTKTTEHTFELHIEDVSTWGKRAHKHTFFELVYVEKGSGIQCINEHEFAYSEGNVFLLPPLDCHSFKVAKPSRFTYIRFTDYFFMNKDGLAHYGDWFNNISYILANYNRVPGDIISSEQDRRFIIQSIKAIQQEYTSMDAFTQPIIMGVMASILNLLARSIENRYVDQANQIESRFGEILRFINQHLTDKERIKLPALAERFGISKTYFSEYFKKQSGETLASYITKSKLRLVETKVLHTDLSLKEIAYQLGFTDSSHLARAFKKAYGMTISAYKAKGGNDCRTA